MLHIVLALAISLAQQTNVHFGNLHSHTSYSDGSGLSGDAYSKAKAAGLDFMAITEHNHSQAESSAGDRRDGLLIATDPALYGKVKAAAAAATSASFVALYGQEFSSINPGNHVNVFEIADVIPESQVLNRSFKNLTDWLATHRDSANKMADLQFR